MLDSSMKILVVDDFQVMRKVVSTCLKQLNYLNIEEASDGVEAFEKLKAQGVDHVIAITNFNLQGESGHSLVDAPEIVNELREKHPDVEIEYISPGFDDEEVAEILVEKINYHLNEGEKG